MRSILDTTGVEPCSASGETLSASQLRRGFRGGSPTSLRRNLYYLPVLKGDEHRARLANITVVIPHRTQPIALARCSLPAGGDD